MNAEMTVGYWRRRALLSENAAWVMARRSQKWFVLWAFTALWALLATAGLVLAVLL